MAGNTPYDTDFYAWTRAQAELLRARRFDELDIEHLAEEIDSVAARERREARNRPMRIIQHFLKFEYQPEKNLLPGTKPLWCSGPIWKTCWRTTRRYGLNLKICWKVHTDSREIERSRKRISIITCSRADVLTRSTIS